MKSKLKWSMLFTGIAVIIVIVQLNRYEYIVDDNGIPLRIDRITGDQCIVDKAYKRQLTTYIFAYEYLLNLERC